MTDNTTTESTATDQPATTPEPTLESVCEQLDAFTDRVSELEAEVERKDERIEDLYDVEQREYVRKADVDEDVKETRLQGLKIDSPRPRATTLRSSDVKLTISKTASMS
jgi:hypothetical protein